VKEIELKLIYHTEKKEFRRQTDGKEYDFDAIIKALENSIPVMIIPYGREVLSINNLGDKGDMK